MINEKHFVDSNPNYFKEKEERERLANKLKNKSEEEILREWLNTCPFDYLMVGKLKGLRTVNFEIEENKDE
tara:strand:- start:1721 stop:1933 length:213 start_codon:yes stop_codon:yes gene_type:complete